MPLSCPAGVPFPTTPTDFEVTTTSGVAPVVVQVIPAGNAAALILSGPIPAGSWTCIALVAGGDQMCLGNLPGDVNGDGTSAPPDILAVIDSLNGVAPRPDYATDVDRSNAAGPEDILRVIDLLNGAASFAPWLDAGIGPCPSGP